MRCQFITGPYMSVCGFQYLAQAYLGSVLKVFWPLFLLPEHFPHFYYTGAWTQNSLLLILVPNRLSCHFLGVIQVLLTSGIWCCAFNTDKLIYQLLCTNTVSVAARLPGAKNQTETGWNVGEIILTQHWNSNSCILFIEVNGSQQLILVLSLCWSMDDHCLYVTILFEHMIHVSQNNMACWH